MKRLALIVAVLLLAVPAMAMASGDDVLEDCADDQELSRTYSQAEYKKALANIPADLDEYTDCRAIIRRAQLKRAGGSGPGQTSGTSKSSKHSHAKTRKQRHEEHVAAQGLGSGKKAIKPATLNSSAGIPAPLIIVILLTLLGAIGAGAIYIRRFVLSRRNR